MALGRWLREPALGIWVLDGFFMTPVQQTKKWYTGRRGIRGETPVCQHLSRRIHLELISFVVYAFMPAFFFHHLLIPFSRVFFNQAILFINMHEGASAWFYREKGR